MGDAKWHLRQLVGLKDKLEAQAANRFLNFLKIPFVCPYVRTLDLIDAPGVCIRNSRLHDVMRHMTGLEWVSIGPCMWRHPSEKRIFLEVLREIGARLCETRLGAASSRWRSAIP